jgi:hypothetical protein
MTTIACNRREMACDSRQSGDELYFRVSDKVVRINGHLVGCCGDVDQIFKFIAWYREDAPANPPKLADTFGAVTLSPAGHIHYYGGCGYPTLIGEPFFAIGSGALAALAAMTCGNGSD